MYNPYNQYPSTYYHAMHGYGSSYPMYQYPNWYQNPAYNPGYTPHMELKDYGPQPFVFNIRKATLQNHNFRTALWTGCQLQLTLMNLKVGEDIGLEVHPYYDQFLCIEEGQGIVKMGDCKDNLDLQWNVHENCAIIIPAGKWHNLINTGCKPLKLYSIYAPPAHPFGTIHPTKEDAEEDHDH